ncbi:MAG: AFG1 family ATPase [Gammaproteobacteria bacterium]|nr:AFG1 family ATPase [Gammaproteobacteria bacterium]
MTPIQRYQQDVDAGLLFPDPAQMAALQYLHQLHGELVARSQTAPPDIRTRIKHWFKKPEPVFLRGVYFWGGVGRGKTLLMDVFYDSLPGEDKLRTHFHRFMQSVHRELNLLKGEKNPLKLVAAKIAANAQIICFDEFFVSDIGDAMILAGLLQSLFEEGVVMVATSNIEPANLYHNGLQRDRFLPAIELLETRMEVVEIAGGVDYRLRTLSQAELYHCPLDKAAEAMLLENFKCLAPDFAEAVHSAEIDILGRPIQSCYYCDDVIWFDFEQLCAGPRSSFDYVEISRIYHALLIGGITQLDDSREDQVRRFISLVDELYDHNVKLIISAAVPLPSLYVGTALGFEFQRTLSRLLEMQSHDYLSRPHRP